MSESLEPHGVLAIELAAAAAMEARQRQGRHGHM